MKNSMPDGSRMSWRIILKYYSDLSRDEWITPRRFSELFSVPLYRAENHTRRLCDWHLLERREIRDSRGMKYEYRITNYGLKKIDYSIEKLTKELEALKSPNIISINADTGKDN